MIVSVCVCIHTSAVCVCVYTHPQLFCVLHVHVSFMVWVAGCVVRACVCVCACWIYMLCVCVCMHIWRVRVGASRTS